MPQPTPSATARIPRASRRTSAVMLLVAAWLALTSCGQASAPIAAEDRPVIVVSIFPLADVISQLVSPWAEVVTLLPPGADPLTYELTPQQEQMIANADAVVLAGSGVDIWAEEAQATLSPPNQRVLHFVRIVSLYAPANAMADPHASTDLERVQWLNPWQHPTLLDTFVLRSGPPLEALFDEPRQVALRTRVRLTRANVLRAQQQRAARMHDLISRECVADTEAMAALFAWVGVKPLTTLATLGLTPGEPMDAEALALLRRAVVSSNIPAIYIDRAWSDTEVRKLAEVAGVHVLRLEGIHPGAVEKPVFIELWERNVATIEQGQGRKLLSQ